MNKRVELLAPAGDLERLKTAVHFGADAVYLGGPLLHLRAAPTDFSMEKLQESIDFCHGKGKKIYVTLNAFAREYDLEQIPGYAAELCDMGVDAVLVSDLGVFSQVRKGAPKLPVHISTQANCLNSEAAKMWYNLGARRIVLGREMTLEEIIELRRNIPEDLEIEVFVHGAMCMSYSGRCMLSNVLTGRDANRGGCAQPCRWKYYLQEEKRPGVYIPIEEDKDGTYVLSAWDLNLLPYLDQLREAGVDSFKLEGRMKTPYYVATTVNAYRRAMDHTQEIPLLMDELNCASHRNYSTGFLFGRDGAKSGAEGYQQDCMFIGPVLQVENGRCQVEMRGRFALGDRLEILSPYSFGESLEVRDLRDEAGEPLPEAIRTLQIVSFEADSKIHPGDILRKRISN